MAKTSRTIDDQATTGTERTLGPFPVSKALASGEMVLDRVGFIDVTASLRMIAEWSLDSGKTWTTWCGFRVRGGTFDKNESGVTPSDVPPRGSSLRVRVKTNGKTVQQTIKLVEEEASGNSR